MPATIPCPAAAPVALPTGRMRTLALIVIGCVLVMDILDLTIVNVAIPTLQAALHATETQIQWMIAGYAGVFAVLLITGGRLGDIFGYRRMLMIGLGGFVVASLLCGLAPGADWLVAARLLQAVMAACMLPQIASLVQTLYPPHERISVLGVFGVLGGTAAIAGPVVGGLLLAANIGGLGWRPIFLVNLPVGLATLLAAWKLLPATRSGLSPKLDLPGTLLVSITLATIMVPLVEGRVLGWPLWCFAVLACAPVLIVVLLRHSRRRNARDGSAIIVTSLFGLPSFRLGLGMITIFQASFTAFLFIFTQVLQQGLHFSAATVGLIHAPYAVGSAIGIGVLSRKVLPRLGPPLLTAGAAVFALALTALTVRIAMAGTRPSDLLPMTFFMGLGMGMLTGPLSPITLSEVDTDYAGGASGMLKSCQEIGGAIGIAVIGGLFFTLRDRPGTSAVEAFTVIAAIIALLILGVGAMALAVPRSLRIFGAGISPDIPAQKVLFRQTEAH